jgi:hypothetical protein
VPHRARSWPRPRAARRGAVAATAPGADSRSVTVPPLHPSLTPGRAAGRAPTTGPPRTGAAQRGDRTSADSGRGARCTAATARRLGRRRCRTVTAPSSTLTPPPPRYPSQQPFIGLGAPLLLALASRRNCWRGKKPVYSPASRSWIVCGGNSL